MRRLDAKSVSHGIVFAAAGLFLCSLVTRDANAEARRFELRIENGRLSESPAVIQVRREDSVELVWSADRETVLHLHGYDLEVTVDPKETKTMRFVARATGRFPIELHDRRHRVLMYLEVHPR
jgi:hypothetical protein